MKLMIVILATAASCFANDSLAAQTNSSRVARLGMLSDTESFTNPISPQDWVAAFRSGLSDAGYTEGKNTAFEFRNGDHDPQKLAKYAAELAAMRVDIIVASSTTAAKAAKAATQTVPIVFWRAEPISSGLVQNLDHPRENLTGVTANEEQQTEFLAQLKEIVPRLDHIAILFNPSYAPVPGLLKYAEQGARALRLSPHFVKVATPEDLPQAFVEMKRKGCLAVLVLNHGMFFRERSKLAELAIENGIALSTPYLRNAEAGALIAHEADFDQVWRMNASYVDKILKGANPGDLPVQKVSFRYAINLKTAKALGLTIPESILAHAALVIPDSPPVRDSNSAGPLQNTPKSEHSTDQEVLALEEQMEALLRSNSDARTAFWAEDFVYINGDGMVSDKGRLASTVSAGEVKIESLEVTEKKVRVYGDVAVVTALEHRRGSFHGRESRDFLVRYTRVWARRGGTWQLVSEQRTPFTSTPPRTVAEVTLNGLRFHYLEWGNKSSPAMLVIPGTGGGGGCAEGLTPFASAMRDRYHVYAMEQRGQCDSEWAKEYTWQSVLQDMDAFIDAFHLAPVTIVGHSSGAVWGYLYAAQHPEKVARLVAVDGGGNLPKTRADAQQRTTPTAPHVTFTSPEEAFTYAKTRWRTESSVDATVREWILHGTRKLDNGKWGWRQDPAAIAAIDQFVFLPTGDELEAAFPRVKCPTLIVRGSDGAVSRELAEHVAHAIPNGRWVEVSDSGHVVHLANPAGFLAAVRNFLE